MKIIIYIFIIFLLCACTTFKKTSSNQTIQWEECAMFPVLDSIKLMETFPDDYYKIPIDTISEKILSFGNLILPCLVERMKDTTVTNIRIADSYNYLVGDVATMLIFYNRHRNVYLKQFLFQTFKADLKDEDSNIFILEPVYYKLFFANNPSTNYSNRLKFYEFVRRKIDILCEP